MEHRRYLIRLGLALTLVVAGSPGATRAQEPARIVAILQGEPPVLDEDEDEPEERPELQLPVAHLLDGGKVFGQLGIGSLAVETRYGTVSIPLNELQRVRFARRLDATTAAASGGHDDAMTEFRAKGVLPPLAGDEDECVTPHMVVRGRVIVQEITLASRYGDLTLPTAELSALVLRAEGPVSQKVQVMPSYQPPANWLDTKIELQKGDRIRLEASGMLRVNSWGVTSGPAGTNEYSTSRTYLRLPMLALVGRVGRKDDGFAVGTEYSARVRSGGRLYLSIVPFQYSPGEVSGSYEVQVTVKRQP